MARFFSRPTISDHLDDLFGSWFVKSAHPGGDGGGTATPPNCLPEHGGGFDPIPDHPDPEPPSTPPAPRDIIKFWLHKIFGDHDHNPPPPPPPAQNHAPQILLAEQGGRIPEGDTTDALRASGTIRFIDRDLGDTQTVQTEFVSTTDPSGQELGALGAVINSNAPGGMSAGALPAGFLGSLFRSATWSYSVNDADLQHLSEGQVVLQTYRVTVTDAAGAQDSRLVTIRLEGHNDAPTVAAVEATAEVSGDPVVGQFAGDDVDGDDSASTLHYEIVGQPSGGTIVNNNDGTFAFNPGDDFNDLAQGQTREVVVSYRAIDSHGAVSSESTITITVRGTGSAPSEPPVIEDQNFAVPEESAAGKDVGRVVATDPDSTTLSYAIVEGNDVGLFVIDDATGAIRLARPVDDPEVGTYALRVAVSDGEHTTTATVTVDVTPVNDAPVAADGAATIRANEVLTGTLPAATDAEDNSITYSIGQQALNGTVVVNDDGGYTYTPKSGFSGTDSFSYVVDDGHGGTNQYEFIVTVTPASSAPEAHTDTNAADAVIEAGIDAAGRPIGDATASGNALDNDSGQGLSVVAVGAGVAVPPQNSGVGTEIEGTFGKLTLDADGQWTYQLDDARPATEALAAGQVAHDVFTYTAADENGATSTTTLIIAVTGSADQARPIAPRAVADINTNDAVVEAGNQPDGTPIPGDATAQGNVLANDQGTGLAVVGIAAGPLFDPVSGGLSTDIVGTYGTLRLGVDGQWSYQLDDSRPATDALAAGQQATDVFTYTIEDASGQTSTTQLFVVVSGSNDAIANRPPVANPDTNKGDPVVEAGIDTTGAPTPGDPTAHGNVLANDTDPDTGDVLAVAGVVFGLATEDQTAGVPTAPIDGTYGSLSIDAKGEWTYTLDNTRPATEALAAGQQATEVFTYTIRDQAGHLSTTTLSIVVTGSADAPANRAPDATDDAVTVPIGATTVVVGVLGNDSDPDGDPLSVVGVTNLPADVIAKVVDTDRDGRADAVELTAASGKFPPAFDFQYTVSDGKGGRDTATVSVTSVAANRAPDATDDAFTVPAGATTVVVGVLGNDSDPDGDPLSVVDVANLPADVIAKPFDTDGDGRADAIELTAVSGKFSSAFDFQYTISDGKGGTDNATVSVTSVAPNTRPVASDDPLATGENASLPIDLADLTANDRDAEGDPLTVTAIDGIDLSGVPVGGVITLASGATLVRGDATHFLYNPGTAFDSLGATVKALDEFSYTISDGRGGESTAIVKITIDGANDAPVAVTDTATATPQTLVYFAADANVLNGAGRELYAFNPATGALALVADVNDLSRSGSEPESLIPLGGKLYFVANGNNATDGEVGRELYVYDRATGNTNLVADLFTGPDSSSPANPVVLDGKLYFTAYGNNATDGEVGQELYVLDPAVGTPAVVADVNPGPNSSNPSELTADGGKLYFAAYDDATAATLLRVLDPATGEINPVFDSNSGLVISDPDQLTVVDGKLYFSAEGDTGRELYFIDTRSATDARPIADIDEGPEGSSPEGITALDGKIYFSVYGNNSVDGEVGRELYVYDPATGSTTLAADVNAGVASSNPSDITALDGKLYFTAGTNNPETGDRTSELYVYDPATGMATQIPATSSDPGGSSPTELTVLDGKLYFVADGNNPTDGDVGREIYVYDPATGDTRLLADINQGSAASIETRLAIGKQGPGPSDLRVIDGKLYFSAEGNNPTDGAVGREPYVYDPATGIVSLVADVRTDPVVDKARGGTPIVIDNKLYFAADGVNATDGNIGQELYVLDPATGVPTPITDLGTGPLNSNPLPQAVIDGRLYFIATGNNATDGNVGQELYVYDPATGATKLVGDLAAGPDGSRPDNIVGLDGKVYFTATGNNATEGDVGNELHVYDPATGTTALVADLATGPDGSFPGQLTVLDGKLYFAASGSDGNELYVLDPAVGTPTLVADLATGPIDSFPNQFTVLDGKLYFTASGDAGTELYVLDPATNTPTLVADLAMGSDSSNPGQLTVLAGKLYFTAWGNNPTEGNVGQELYVLDPAVGSPRLVADLSSGATPSFPQELTVVDGRLYFIAEGTNAAGDPLGQELYVLDPATDTPVLVADLATGAQGSFPQNLTLLDGKVYFSAYGDNATDGQVGIELYVYDPVAGTTTLLPEASTGVDSSDPTELTVLDGKLYFVADGNNATDGIVGRELYVYDPATNTTSLIADLNTIPGPTKNPGPAPELTVAEAGTSNGGSNPSGLTVIDGKLYFSALGANDTDGIVGPALYVYDPATGSTSLVADLSTRSQPSNPTEFTPLDSPPGASGNVLANDTNVDNGDTKTVVGVEAGTTTDAISGNVDTEIAGLYGTLVLHADGSWVYVQDRGAPQANDPQTDMFSYTMADAAGATSTTTLSVAVQLGPDTPPVAVDDAATISENDVLTIKLSELVANDRDPDGDTLTVTTIGKIDLATLPPGSSITAGTETITRVDTDTITVDFGGQFDSLGANDSRILNANYVISDGRGGTDIGALRVAINGVNDTPVAVTDIAAIAPLDVPPGANGNVLDNDTDIDNGDTKMVVGVEAGTVTDPISGNVDTAIAGLYGTLVVHADGSWVYVQDLGAPQTGDPTTDVFSYTMADAAGATSTTTLTIDLNGGANQAPTAVDDTVSVVPGQSAVLDILTNDSDPDRDSLAIASVTAPTQGTAELRDADGDGRVDLVYTARTDARGTDSFTYTIDDGHGHTATAAVTVEFPAQGSVSGGDGPSSGTSPTTGGSGSTPVTGTTGDPTATPIGSGGSTTTTTTAGQATATAANDHFVYHLGDGPLTIAGFEPGSQGQTADQIELAGFNLNFNSPDTNGDQRIDAMDANVSSDGAGGITLHLGNQDDLTVTHVTTLHQDDLLFS